MLNIIRTEKLGTQTGLEFVGAIFPRTNYIPVISVHGARIAGRISTQWLSERVRFMPPKKTRDERQRLIDERLKHIGSREIFSVVSQTF